MSARPPCGCPSRSGHERSGRGETQHDGQHARGRAEKTSHQQGDTDAPTRLLTAATMLADVNIAASPPAQAGLDVPVAEGLPVLAVDPVELLVVYNRLKSRTSRPERDEVP